MFALLRLALILFVVMTIAYFSLSLYSRARCRDRLEAEWDVTKGPREIFIDEGLRDYDQSLRKKLIWGVYVVPTLLIVLIIYLTNFA
jgi:hypothetical protein